MSKRFSSAGRMIDVLTDVDLAVSSGETVAVVGPSGSGKSTLLRIMGTLDRASEGSVSIEGTDVTSMNATELSDLRNQRLGFVFQSHCLLPQCSVLENVLIPTLVSRDRYAAAGCLRATHLLERVGLGERLDNRPGQLSGGECQRVALVRALINKPELLLADEPTGSLDRKNSESLTQLLMELNREERVAMVVVTHSEPLAQSMGTLKHLEDGRLV